MKIKGIYQYLSAGHLTLPHRNNRSFKVFLFIFTFHISLITSYLNAQVTLFGMTMTGGTNGNGNLFDYNVTTGTFNDLVDLTGTSGLFIGKNPNLNGLMQATDGYIYGMCDSGGVNGFGNIFKYDPVSQSYTDLVDFTGTSGAFIGANPNGSLVQAYDGKLYGMTENGGSHGFGNIFRFDPATSVFANLIEFSANSGSHSGWAPNGSFVLAKDSCLYGMTVEGGLTFTPGFGNIFKFNPKTNIFTNLLDFSGTFSGSHNGATPYGSLIQAKDGYFYGMTETGGIGIGNIFKYDPITNAFSNLVQFSGTSGPSVGEHPNGDLVEATDGNLYGTTSIGGSLGKGNIFKYDPVNNVYINLVNFTGSSGSYIGWGPYSSLIQASDGYLYGMNHSGGTMNAGNIYKYDIVTNTFTDIVDFTGTSGAFNGKFPKGKLLEYKNSTLNVPTVVNPDAILIYPNPNSGIFTIDGLKQNTMIKILNSMGEIVYGSNGNNKYQTIDLSKKPEGIYFVQILDENTIVNTSKIVIH